MSRRNILDFIALPLKFSEESSAHHQIFAKEHNIRNQAEETPRARTLFVLNIPPYASEASIKRIFNAAGPVQNVILQEKKTTGFRSAYVVYKTENGLTKSLKLTKLEPLSVPGEQIVHGVSKWVKSYNESIPNISKMQKEISRFMATYDKEVAKRKKEEQKSGEEDEEGWITVTKHGRKPGLARKEAVEQRLKEKIEKSKKKKELKNFYTFQIRESKMKHLASLRQKFEEDKRKINALKQARKFKPF